MRTTAPKLVAAVAAVTALVVSVASPVGAGRASPLPPTFQRVAVIPAAAAQPTATGRAVVDLQVFDGRVYTGFGDYGANTGPIDITAYDPAAGTTSVEFRADTEAVLNLRPVEGRLYAPSIDPRVSADLADGGPWRERSVVDAAHVFDVASAHGLLWMVGSEGSNAVAWQSADGGESWQPSLVIGPRNPTDFARFYFAGVLGGDLYVQAFDASGGAHPAARVFDGTAWTDAPPLVAGREPGWRPVEHGRQLIFSAVGQGYGSAIKAYDGTTVRALAYGYDFEVVGRDLYVLGLDGTVSSTSPTLRRWATHGVAPLGSRSLAIDGDTAYVGTASSELWAQALR